jgi:hypothetical protein
MTVNTKALLSTLFLCSFASASFAAPILASSTFDSDAEGWTALTTPASSAWTVAGGAVVNFSADGVPSGSIVVADPDNEWTYFVAPSSFLGNMSAAMGGSLTFDSRYVVPASAYVNEADVVLKGAGLALVYDATNSLPGTWTHFDIPLASGAWRVADTFSGPLATDAQILSVLSSLDALWINAEHFTPVSESIALDNVVLSAPVPEPETWAMMVLGVALVGVFGRRRG